MFLTCDTYDHYSSFFYIENLQNHLVLPYLLDDLTHINIIPPGSLGSEMKKWNTGKNFYIFHISIRCFYR